MFQLEKNSLFVSWQENVSKEVKSGGETDQSRGISWPERSSWSLSPEAAALPSGRSSWSPPTHSSRPCHSWSWLRCLTPSEQDRGGREETVWLYCRTEAPFEYRGSLLKQEIVVDNWADLRSDTSLRAVQGWSELIMSKWTCGVGRLPHIILIAQAGSITDQTCLTCITSCCDREPCSQWEPVKGEAWSIFADSIYVLCQILFSRRWNMHQLTDRRLISIKNRFSLSSCLWFIQGYRRD